MRLERLVGCTAFLAGPGLATLAALPLLITSGSGGRGGRFSRCPSTSTWLNCSTPAGGRHGMRAKVWAWSRSTLTTVATGRPGRKTPSSPR